MSTTTTTSVFESPDLVELLADEPELLALADAIALTQTRPAREAGHRSGSLRTRRALILVAAAAVVLVAVGATLAATVGGFSSWLTGTPGVPASPKAQRQFRAANSLSYAAFPAGTVLHRLIVERAGGATYRLYGFHYGDQLCLRLVVQGISGQPAISCAPRIALQRSRVPVQVADVDYPFGRGKLLKPRPGGGTYFVVVPRDKPLPRLFAPPAASASFGFVADGVTGVVLRSSRYRLRAAVAANAFLAIRVRPETANPITRISAVTSGHSLSVPFATPPFGLGQEPANAKIPGPKKVQQQPGAGSIGWVLRHQPRGESLTQAGVSRRTLIGFHQAGGVAFARVLTPDPQSTIRVIVSLIGRHGHNLCLLTLLARSSGGGCSVRLDPISSQEMYDLFQGGNQFEVISGLAGDGVAKIELYLSDGEHWPVALRDNAFAIQAPRDKLPGELVAYNSGGKIVGITPERSS